MGPQVSHSKVKRVDRCMKWLQIKQRIFDSSVSPLVALFTGCLNRHVCLSWPRKNVPKWWNKSSFGCEIPHIVSASPQIRSAAPVSRHSSGFSQIRARTFSIGLLKLRKIPAARMLPVESQGHLFPPWNRLDKVRAVIFNWFHSHFTHEGKCWWNQLVTRRKTGAMLAGRVNILCKGMWNEVISAAWEEVPNVNVERRLIPGITAASSD